MEPGDASDPGEVPTPPALALTPPGYQPGNGNPFAHIALVRSLQLSDKGSSGLTPGPGSADGFTPSPGLLALHPEYALSLATPGVDPPVPPSSDQAPQTGLPLPGFLKEGYLGNCVKNEGVVIPGLPGSFVPRFDRGAFPNLPSGLDYKLRF